MSYLLSLIPLTSYILITHSTPRIREYHFVTTARTWNESKTYCQENYGTDLATILTKDDLNSAMFTIPIIVGHTIKRVFTGLNDKDIEGEWKWSDNTTCQFDNTTGGHECSDFWYLGEPNDYEKNGGEDCGVLWWHADAWVFNDSPCDNPASFLCNKDFEYTYVYNGTFLNWTQAEDNCNKNHGGMATVQTTQDFMQALSVLPHGVDHVWIGLNDFREEGTWEWSNGDACKNNNISHHCSVYWSPGQPDDWETGEDCGEMWFYRETQTWLFNDRWCDYTMASLCIEANTAHPTPQPTPDRSNAYFALSLTQRTWAESLVYCEQNYYGLASIVNQFELDQIVALMPNYQDMMSVHYAWIGLNDLQQEGVWVWSDGTSCVLDNNNCTDLWNPGEPNNYYTHPEGENCAQILWVGRLKAWKVNDKMCDYMYGAVCRRNETTGNPTIDPTPAPTVKPTRLPTSKPTWRPTGMALPSLRPTRAPTIARVVNDTAQVKGGGSASTGVSTLDVALVSIIIVLVIALATTVFCLVRFKVMYKRIGEISEYIGHKNDNVDTTKSDDREMRLVADDGQVATTIN